MNQTPSPDNDQIIHCLVHPGFDAFEHPEFEANILEYISHIAARTQDVLLIISDGERLYEEQMRKFALLDTVQTIAFFLAQIQVSTDMKYEEFYEDYWLSQEFFDWCMSHIDISGLIEIEQEQFALREAFLVWKGIWDLLTNYREQKRKCDALIERRNQEMIDIDIQGKAELALEEFWSINGRSHLPRKVRNRGRFFRIYQHAMKTLWPERVREIFIADGEDVEALPVLPVLQYKTGLDTDPILTELVEIPGDFWGMSFNISEPERFGNAAELRDKLTTELSWSRNQSLASQQAPDVLVDMWVEVTDNTKFIFFGEYRDRCVDHVFHVLNYRMSPISWDNWFIANDDFTLERPKYHISYSWF